MSDSSAPYLTALAADDVIEAARFMLVILDGGPFNCNLTPAGLFALAVFTVAVMLDNAALSGIEGADAQAAEVRRALNKSITHATLQGLARDEEAADG